MIITYEDLEAHEGHQIGINKEGQYFILVCVDDTHIFWRMRPIQKSSACCPSCQETFMYKGVNMNEEGINSTSI